jgi:hypothetical protein
MLRTVVTDDDTCSLLWQKPVNLPSPQQKQRRAQSSTGIQTTVDLHADSEAATHFLRGKDGGRMDQKLGPRIRSNSQSSRDDRMARDRHPHEERREAGALPSFRRLASCLCCFGARGEEAG